MCWSRSRNSRWTAFPLVCVCSLNCKYVYSGLGQPLLAILNSAKLCCSSENPLPFVSLACVDTVTVSMQTAVEGVPGRLPEAFVVTRSQNRGCILRSVPRYTPYISKLTITSEEWLPCCARELTCAGFELTYSYRVCYKGPCVAELKGR